MNKELKYCKGCQIEKPIIEFNKHKDKKNGKYYYGSCYCKKCEAKKIKMYAQKHKEKLKEYLKNYVLEHKEKLREQGHQNYLKNREEKIEYQKQYYQEHKKEKREYDIKYRTLNKEKRNINESNLYKTDKIYRLKKQLRNCIYKSFTKKGFYKKENTEKIIGCEYKTFITHLLNSFKERYGYEWDGVENVHIDHIIPLITANTEEEILNLCYYKNLQLLKAKDNLIKSSKVNYNWED